MTKDPEQYINECLDWLARHRASLDQKKKLFEDQYPMRHPKINQVRLEDIEAWTLELEINEYELGGFIKDYIDSLEESDGADCQS